MGIAITVPYIEKALFLATMATPVSNKLKINTLYG